MEEKKKTKKDKTRTYIGGQAVIEGVMMRGKSAMATAVRDSDGEIQIESKRIVSSEQKSLFVRLPFVRGVVNFWDSLVGGMKILMRSAEVYGAEEEPTKTEKWFAKKFNVSVMDVISVFSVILGVVLAIGLFFFLPVFLTGFISNSSPEKIPMGGLIYNLILGGMRLVIFIVYIIFTSLLKDMRRTYMYHGAEHKTIACYEYGMPLTVENVKKCSRIHDRCGTTFLFIVMIVSIIIFALISGGIKMIPVVGEFFDTVEASSRHKILANAAMFLIHLLFLPLVAGTSYEILRLLSKSQAKILLIFKAPGLALQFLTTRKPDDGMIECAIAAFNRVLEMDADPEYPETSFVVPQKLSDVSAEIKKAFKENNIEEEEADWIISIVLDVAKSSLVGNMIISKADNVKIADIVKERLTGRPLWYIIGDTSFCGFKIKVDERVLIPRPETEELVEQAGKCMQPSYTKVLDMCTGSGAIAIAFSKRLASEREIEVFASDISDDALVLARENAELNDVKIEFIKSDYFSKIKGKYHMIISNPPYIESETINTLQREVKDHEPRIALDGGEDGLDAYRTIAEKAAAHIYKGGVLLLECGDGQARKIVKFFDGRCDYAIIIRDFNGVERFIKVVM